MLRDRPGRSGCVRDAPARGERARSLAPRVAMPVRPLAVCGVRRCDSCSHGLWHSVVKNRCIRRDRLDVREKVRIVDIGRFSAECRPVLGRWVDVGTIRSPLSLWGRFGLVPRSDPRGAEQGVPRTAFCRGGAWSWRGRDPRHNSPKGRIDGLFLRASGARTGSNRWRPGRSGIDRRTRGAACVPHFESGGLGRPPKEDACSARCPHSAGSGRGRARPVMFATPVCEIPQFRREDDW